ncbi:G2/M phase-specific E3 ubiquitin-protein ligase-like [Haliotis rufescens]|uniref:G2/M phase-specific E3 ubiquitin-protein ligase-like n=1 Tax=Haliotis rufescens TaxID=6454 RepID=UPI00201F5404|nr:G2/M phase-specific E3 ubiquitin-protein ligase-like [Haliotis rufescens]
MIIVMKQRCPDCGKTFKNLSNHNICHSRGSGKYADQPSMVQRQVCPDCGRDYVNLANHRICHGRGSRHRQTSGPQQSASRSPVLPQSRSHYPDDTSPPQPQLPSRQRSHQQRHHHDLESLLYGRISDASQRDESDTNAASTGSPRNIVREHRSGCMEFGACRISVNRDAVWESSMAFFKDVAVSNKAKQLMVVFTDSEGRHEEGVDTGGPRRECLRLLLQSMVSDSKMLHGDENQGFLIRPSISAYRENHFRVMGVMLATIIAQGGQSPAIFAPPVVDAILDIDQSPSVDYVPNRRKRESLTKVSEAKDATELEEALQECDWRDDLDGIPSYVTMANRDEFLSGCVHHFVILQSKPMVDQLIQGLRHCGILDLIRRHTLRDLLEYRSDVEVTSERVMDLFKPVPSYHGDEHAIFNNLHRFLQAAEEGRLCDVLGEGRCLTRNQTEFARRMTPGRLLTFVTGCSREPAGGFTPRPSIVFNYSATWRLPSASTCSNQIQLTVHPDLLEFQSFCHTMMTSMMNGETFSTA